MPPNNTPNSTTPPPLPNQPPVPNQPQVPNQPNQPQPPTQPQNAQPYNPNQPLTATPYIPYPKKSNTKLIIGIILGVILLLAIPIIIWFVLVFQKNAKISKVSVGFMTAMTQGDVATAITYTDGSENTKQFLNGMAPGVKASSFKLKQVLGKNNNWYFLYDLEGSKNNTARTELKEDASSHKWQIVGFFAGNNLAIIGTESNSEVAQTNPTPLPASSTSCLVQSDFDNWYKSLYSTGKTATEQGLHFENAITPYSTNLHFPADSLEYQGFDVNASSTIDSLESLANDPSVKSKEFKIRLYGSVGTDASDSDFANKRAEKIKTDLIAKGVPGDKIIVDPPKSVQDTGDTSSISQRSARTVVITFDPTCTGSTNTGR